MLEQNHFSLTRTAEQLKISRHALRYRMQRLNIATGTERGRRHGRLREERLIRHEHDSIFPGRRRRPRQCWRHGGSSTPATRERLAIFGAIGLVTLLLLLWAVFLRKKRRRRRSHHHSHQHSSGPAEVPEAPSDEERPSPAGETPAPAAFRPQTPPAQPDPRRNRRLAARPPGRPARTPALTHARKPDDHAQERVESGAGVRPAAQGQTRRHVRPLRLLPRGG